MFLYNKLLHIFLNGTSFLRSYSSVHGIKYLRPRNLSEINAFLGQTTKYPIQAFNFSLKKSIFCANTAREITYLTIYEFQSSMKSETQLFVRV